MSEYEIIVKFTGIVSDLERKLAQISGKVVKLCPQCKHRLSDHHWGLCYAGTCPCGTSEKE